MALHSFLGMTIGVPEPERLEAFYVGMGLAGGSGRWGSRDAPDQIQVAEARYRQLREIRVGCEAEGDLAAIAGRLERLGVACHTRAGRLRCTEPQVGFDVVVEVAPPLQLAPQPGRVWNRPGEQARLHARAEAVIEEPCRPPRRLGHVVVGAPDPKRAFAFFLEGIGFQSSDTIGEALNFMRCSTDHHNLLVQPSPVPHLNHYAFEFDDIDAVGRAASCYLRDRSPDHDVLGLGRHSIGSNVFWYVKDPCGTMSEFYCDMDCIPDQETWERRKGPAPAALGVWGPQHPPQVFFAPADLEDIAKGREAEGR
jgi:catechol 2,3-dioxygenase-like lactoylglutathione lyase family enzyme